MNIVPTDMKFMQVTSDIIYVGILTEGEGIMDNVALFASKEEGFKFLGQISENLRFLKTEKLSLPWHNVIEDIIIPNVPSEYKYFAGHRIHEDDIVKFRELFSKELTLEQVINKLKQDVEI